MNYKVDVLAVNKSLKEYERTLNGAAKRLIACDGVPSKYKVLLREVLKDKSLYAIATGMVRKSKKGLHSPFYVLQWCYKVEKIANEKKLKLSKKEAAASVKLAKAA